MILIVIVVVVVVVVAVITVLVIGCGRRGSVLLLRPQRRADTIVCRSRRLSLCTDGSMGPEEGDAGWCSGGGGRRASVVAAENVRVLPGDVGDLRAEAHVDAGADVAGAEGLDGEVRVDLADEEGGVAVGEVSFLSLVLETPLVFFLLFGHPLYREHGDEMWQVSGENK